MRVIVLVRIASAHACVNAVSTREIRIVVLALESLMKPGFNLPIVALQRTAKIFINNYNASQTYIGIVLAAFNFPL